MTFALSLVDSEILHTPLLQCCSGWNSGVFPLEQIHDVGCAKSEDTRLIAAKLYYENSNLRDHNTLTSWSDGTRAGWNENSDGQDMAIIYVRLTCMGRTWMQVSQKLPPKRARFLKRAAHPPRTAAKEIMEHAVFDSRFVQAQTAVYFLT